MAEVVFVYGRSGSGKSRSLINFGENEVFVVNTLGKRMPFAKKFKYTSTTSNALEIMQLLENMVQFKDAKIKAAVIDDGGYVLTSQFMAGHSKPKSGASSFQLYNDIADNMWNMLLNIKYKLPEDVIVYFVMHEDIDDNGISKLKTIGKLLDQTVCLEGMSTICLHCIVRGNEHLFLTQSNGYDIAKSPEGMFPPEIPNDLAAVDKRIREYWGFEPITKKESK